MKHLFVFALSSLGLALGLTLPGSAHANTPCRAECQSAYNACLFNQPQAECAQQRQECYLECANGGGAATTDDHGDADADRLRHAFERNAQRRPVPLARAG